MVLQASANGHFSNASLQTEWRNSMSFQCTISVLPASSRTLKTMGLWDSGGLQSSLFFESAAEIFARVFRELKPRTVLPTLRVEFCQFANADNFIKLEAGALHVRM